VGTKKHRRLSLKKTKESFQSNRRAHFWLEFSLNQLARFLYCIHLLGRAMETSSLLSKILFFLRKYVLENSTLYTGLMKHMLATPERNQLGEHH
jgi:hypothetical protein